MTFRSWDLAVTPNFGKPRYRWEPTVRGESRRRSPICRLVRPRAARRTICFCCGVRSGSRSPPPGFWRTPAARSSARARAAQGSAPSRTNVSSAAVSSGRARLGRSRRRSRYADPDRFDPTRADIRPLSFGGGAHYCLGALLARLEATVAFGRLPTSIPGLAPAPGTAPTRRDRIVLRGHATFPVVLGGHRTAGM